MKRLIFLGYAFASCANAAIKVETSSNCESKQQRITEFVVSKDNKKLSYRAGGKLHPLAESSDGVLVGRFRALMMSANLSGFDGKWLDISEIPLSEIEARKPKVIDKLFYYLPLQRTLTPSDLGFDSTWRIDDLVFDYNRHQDGVLGEKVWQFTLKNVQARAVTTVSADDAERQLIKRCHQ